MRRASPLLLLLALGAGCKGAAPTATADPATGEATAHVHGNAEPAPAPTLKPSDRKVFGAGVRGTASTPLTEIVSQPGKFTGQTVRTEGKVSAVCKAMGCWLQLEDEQGAAHVTMAGHSFFVPTSIRGKRAAVEGKILKALNESECNEEAKKETGKVAALELEATGVQLLD